MPRRPGDNDAGTPEVRDEDEGKALADALDFVLLGWFTANYAPGADERLTRIAVDVLLRLGAQHAHVVGIGDDELRISLGLKVEEPGVLP